MQCITKATCIRDCLSAQVSSSEILEHVPEISCVAGNSTYLSSAMTFKAHSLAEDAAVWLQSGNMFLSQAVLQVTAHTCRQQ